MKRPVMLLVVVAMLVCASVAQASLFVYGQALAPTAQGTYYASYFHMKWCKANANLAPTNQCGYGTLNAIGYYNISIPEEYGSGYYFPYLWDDTNYWGSQTYPAAYASYLTITNFPYDAGNQIAGGLYSFPAALPSNPVTPAEGSLNVGTSFNLQWTDGLDDYRRSPSWPVTYDIYASGNEYYPETKVFSDIPCNGVGTCSVAVSGVGYTARWQWHVIAHMHSMWVVTWAGPDSTSTTNSSMFHFGTGWDPAVPLHTIGTYNGNLLRAIHGGDGGFDANGTGSTYETQLQIETQVGVNGPVYDGYQVSIRTNRNYYLSAVSGGGYGVTMSTWFNLFETFTVVRLAGPGYVWPGDQIALRSVWGYYVTAEGGGGGAVNANRTAIGPWETFTWH